MKFYIAESDAGGVLNCFTTLREAKEAVRASESQGGVLMVDVPVTAESICRLLGQRGGYANETKVAWESK